MNKIIVNPVLHFRNNDEDYIMNSINCCIFRASPELASKLLENNIEQLQDNTALDILERHFVISRDGNSALNAAYDRMGKENIFWATSVCLLISQVCNLRCSYCYGDGGRYHNKGYMPYDVAAKAIDIIVNNASALGKTPSIGFFGGEPLLNYKLMKQIVAYVKEKQYNVLYSITTNGTLIDEEIERFIVDNRIFTNISIDGDEQVQNKNRYSVDKTGSYRRVISATSNLRKRGLTGARATVTKDNPDFDRQILHLLSLDFRKVNWGYAIETLSKSDLVEMMKSFQRLCDEFYSLVIQEDYESARKFGNIVRYLQKICSANIRERACGAGHSLMAVDIDGRIYPCHRFVSNQEYVIGSVFDDDIKSINDHRFYNDLGIRKHSKCLSCIARNFCCGGCMSSNYDLTSKTTECSETACYQAIEEMKIMAKLYTVLSKEQLSNILTYKSNQEESERIFAEMSS
jgi:uncharacterized protein